ncbi:hypothetical protein, partial [Aureimonas sp. N4]|uniref:hypothetical protein n=2 Tax=unclassified Aureimonas TaxID=2615206 RepID=UPI000AFE278F
MAVETKTIFLGTDWTLISAANTDGTRIVSTVLGYRPMILLADALPASGTPGSVIGSDETVQTGKKLYACSPTDRLVQVQITRTVDSANPAIPELGDLTLSKSSWEAGQTPGSELATISGKTAGSTVALERNDGDLAVSAQGDKLLAGLAPVGPGRYANALIERLAGSARGSKRTPFEYAVPVPASAIGGEKYMLASNRFGLPTDYALNDSGYASGDTSGRSGGNGTSFAKYQYRSWGFSTTFETKEGRFLWANVVNTILGVRPNNFPVTIQRVDVRRWSDGAVVAQVKWGGSTS